MNRETSQTTADERQAKREQLEALSADLIALCAKHNVELESHDGDIVVDRKILHPNGNFKTFDRIGKINSIASDSKVDAVIFKVDV